MRYYQFDDPFINSQPSKSFVADLKRDMHGEKIFSCHRAKKDGEIDLSKINFIVDFNDPQNLLETSYADFRAFMESAGIKNDKSGVNFLIEQGKTDCFEAYAIEVTLSGVRVFASDTEGVRRALIHIEDLMVKAEAPFLSIGRRERKPFVKTRISRCFFSPPSHNENFGMKNELEDDIDYYPDAYLNRLMHDGVNGLWIGANFRDLLTSSIFPENGLDGERRLKKLRAISERAKRYGIGIYLFSVEPASTHRNPALEKREDLLGGSAWGKKIRLFCTSVPEFEEYIRECLTKLFTAVPDLKGFINITTGEACSGCGSTIIFDCPRCKEKFGTHGKTLAATEEIFARLMKEIAPNAEFISWTYAQRGWKEHAPKAFYESLEYRDPSVIHMQNFEDEGTGVQLGKERKLFDYWLSFVGPGKVMTDSLEVNKRRGIKTYAKLQVCSSFDFGSVPYVPVPGILYDKYSYMRDNGISGAMLCWYTGNYPGLMNKAACELSFEPYFENKKKFLLNLAGYYWGESNAEVIADAWVDFEEGYKNYPLNKAFLWYSPFADAPASPLHLIPKDLPVPSSWKYTEVPGGDRVGEMLLDGHTLEEAITLVGVMLSKWKSGMQKLAVVGGDIKPLKDQKVIAKTIETLIASGYNKLKFYELRRLLGIGNGDANKILKKMQSIVEEEIALSQELAPICEEYPYLGYMTEANGFKFFKEKILWRVDQLKNLLATEFTTVRSRITNGLAPLSFYLGKEDGARRVEICADNLDNAKPIAFIPEDGGEPFTLVKAAASSGKVFIRFILKDGEEDRLEIKPEFRMFHPSANFVLTKGDIYMGKQQQFSFWGKVLEDRKKALKCSYYKDGSDSVYTLEFERAAVGQEEKEPFRLAVNRIGKHNENLCVADRIYPRLNLGQISPDAYCFFIDGFSEKYD